MPWLCWLVDRPDAPGILAQCAVEEALELSMGMRGLTHYAETVSVTEPNRFSWTATTLPGRRAFLASAYASRGLKMRMTSGTGSEVQMGYAEGKSMLYLEVRCIMIVRGAGVQGIQNGSISCIGVPGSVPAGIKTVVAENVAAALLNLEVASGSDQTFTHSIERNTARMLPLFFSGTDYIFSGYAAEPNYDNMFAGSTHDTDDYDDYLVLQRDFQVDGGLIPVTEEGVIAVRNKAARALQAVFEESDFLPITDEEVELVTYAHGTKDIGDRNVPEDLRAIDEFMKRGSTGLDIVRALAKRGFKESPTPSCACRSARLLATIFQTSAAYTDKFEVVSAVNNANDYEGPGTGYRLEGERWEKLKNIPQAIDPKDI